jgi:putative hemolysin
MTFFRPLCVVALSLFFSIYSLEVFALANPASTNCIKKGGTLSIQTRGDGGEYGICLFEDNRQCEEWALFRGECPIGGIKVTGYTTPAQIYCVIQGGKTTAVDASAEKQTPCVFPNGTQCMLQAFFDGQCQK